MNNKCCKIYEEQIKLLLSLPNQEEAKNVLYQAVINSYNHFENQNEIQTENQNEYTYISISLSLLSVNILNLLSKNIVWKIYNNNYGGSREKAGRKPKGESKKQSQQQTPLAEEKDSRYGELKWVKLKPSQYEELSKKHSGLSQAIEKLDTWLGTSGSKHRNKNHYAYFKSNSWVWEGIKDSVPQDLTKRDMYNMKPKGIDEYDYNGKTIWYDYITNKKLLNIPFDNPDWRKWNETTREYEDDRLF